MSIEDDVRQLVIRQVNWDGAPADLGADVSLVGEGLIDSIGIFQLVESIEDDLGIEIDDTELVAENFDSIGAIVRLVASKTG